MKLLVTGGAGFIGSQLALALQAEGHDVVVVDRSPKQKKSNLTEFHGEVRTADVSDSNFWPSLTEPFDAVFHEAACTDTTVEDKLYMHKQNVATFEHLLTWATQSTTDVIYASSAAIYGNAPSPQRVGEHEEPLNLYGTSKLQMDQIVRQQLSFTPIKIIGLRYFNVYGPGESYKAHMASMIYKLAQQMKEGTPPRLFTNGEQMRDQIYITDVIQANLCALSAPKEASGIYNVGSGTAVSFNQIVDELNTVLETHLQPDYFENPYNFYQEHTQADIELTREKLGFSPQIDLAQGIKGYKESEAL